MASAAQAKSGDSRLVSDLCPEAYERLTRFQWEYVGQSRVVDKQWLAYWHGVGNGGVITDGLAEAAEAAIRAIQAELHRTTEPLDRPWALQLDCGGHLARLALFHLGGGTWKLAKEVEASAAAPDGPLAICLGRSSHEMVTAQTGSGRTLLVPLGMYGGCLRTFPSNPAAKHWPARWCDECRRLRQTNERRKAVTQLRRRAADGY